MTDEYDGLTAAAWRDEWRTVHGDKSHVYDDRAEAAADANQFPWPIVQHRRVTDWQTIHPTPHAEPDCRTCDRGSVDCCDPWESPHDPSSYAYEHTKEIAHDHE